MGSTVVKLVYITVRPYNTYYILEKHTYWFALSFQFYSMKLEVSVKVDDIFLFSKAQKAAFRQRLSGEEQWLTIAPETFEADVYLTAVLLKSRSITILP